MGPELAIFKEMVKDLPPESTGLKTKIVVDLIRHVEFLQDEVKAWQGLAAAWKMVADGLLAKEKAKP